VPSLPTLDDSFSTNPTPGPPNHQKHAANKEYGEPNPTKHDHSKIFPGRNRTSLKKLSSVYVSKFLGGEFDDETFMCSQTKIIEKLFQDCTSDIEKDEMINAGITSKGIL
jgi:hypothetical protein